MFHRDCPYCLEPVPITEPWDAHGVICPWCDRLCGLRLDETFPAANKGKAWQARMTLRREES